MIAVIDYGSGNIQAIVNIYNRLNLDCKVASCPEDLAGVSHIILPGVGSFDFAMAQLDASDMCAALDRYVMQEGTPVLGICVGMQILANSSDEGRASGLGWIPGAVRRFDEARITGKPKLPHMGWNDIRVERDSPLFEGVDLRQGFYFLHSYYFSCEDAGDALASATYGDSFTCAVARRNVYGVQFHPEKSHANGIRLFRNFAGL